MQTPRRRREKERTMLDKTKDRPAEDLARAAEEWLDRFESALQTPAAPALQELFHSDSHWRDVLALTWRIGTISGADAVVRELNAHAVRAAPKNFRIDPARDRKSVV